MEKDAAGCRAFHRNYIVGGDAERVVDYYDVSLFHVSKNMEIIAEELAERFEKKHEKDIERIAHIDISKQK